MSVALPQLRANLPEADPLPPLVRDYSRGADLKAKLRVLGRINEGYTPRHAAKLEGVPQGTVLGWLQRYKAR